LHTLQVASALSYHSTSNTFTFASMAPSSVAALFMMLGSAGALRLDERALQAATATYATAASRSASKDEAMVNDSYAISYQLYAADTSCRMSGWLKSGAHALVMTVQQCADRVAAGGWADTNAGYPCASDVCGRTFFRYHTNQWCGCATERPWNNAGDTEGPDGCNPYLGNAVLYASGNGNTLYQNLLSGETCAAPTLAPTPAPTAAPTASPTPAPTPTPTPVPTPPTGASAVGDPHLTTIHGQRFDLMKPGKHVLINIPRKRIRNVLLRVEAEAQRFGGQCADLYFQELNVTGAWAYEKHAGGLRYHAKDAPSTRAQWIGYGRVQLKVAHGRTQQGIKYLNIYVKGLARTGFDVGGLLGEDDHSSVAVAPQECGHHVNL